MTAACPACGSRYELRDTKVVTAPQPAEPQPDVTQLVEALERCVTSMIDSGYRADAVVVQASRYAIAAHRKQGEEK